MTRPTPELLAPAGDWTALKAAVANGADAVYFGVAGFNARARAANFTADELPTVMTFLHDRNVRGFVALNTLAFPGELPAVAELVERIAAAGVDAVIVQDLGVVKLVKQLAPTLAVHASTQMTLTEPHGIRFVTELGVERVVLARELSLADIRRVTAATETPVEVFIHGALCVAYSGQCLTSEALGGRSANRGQCAQACRLPYEMLVDGQPRDLGDRAYLLSPQDLAAHAQMADLVAAGVISFKIEGRLKGGPYVAATTQTYRRALDAAQIQTSFALNATEQRDLAQVFSRGLTPGFLDGVNHQKLVRGRVPKSRGVLLGTVTNRTNRTVRVRLQPELPPGSIKPGDGVLFDLGTPELDEPGGRVWAVRGDGEVELELEHVDLTRVPIGCEVWKTDDPALRRRLEQTYAQDRLIHRQSLAATITGNLGGAVRLRFQTPAGFISEAEWPGPLALATSRPTPADEAREQLGRLGDTPFRLEALHWNLPAGVMVPKAVLNDLRRRAAAELATIVRVARQHPVTDPAALRTLRAARPVPAPPPPGPAALTVLVRNLAQLHAVLAWQPPPEVTRPAWVYCDFEDPRGYADAVPIARSADIPIALAPPCIWKPGEDGFNALLVRANPDGVLVRNLAGIRYFRDRLPAATLVGDFSLNCANDLTAGVLIDAGLTRLVPSFDLNWEQLRALLETVDPTRFEPVVHQHMPMFHMEHCVFAAFLSNGIDHRDCGRPCDRHEVSLKDRVGAVFPVHPDAGCRNTVFNSVPQSAAEYIGRMRDLGVRQVRVDLLRETAGELAPLLTHYSRVAAGLDTGATTWKQVRALNQLGVTRGTLNLV